jgi:hypothetical protein
MRSDWLHHYTTKHTCPVGSFCLFPKLKIVFRDSRRFPPTETWINAARGGGDNERCWQGVDWAAFFRHELRNDGLNALRSKVNALKLYITTLQELFDLVDCLVQSDPKVDV